MTIKQQIATQEAVLQKIQDVSSDLSVIEAKNHALFLRKERLMQFVQKLQNSENRLNQKRKFLEFRKTARRT